MCSKGCISVDIASLFFCYVEYLVEWVTGRNGLIQDLEELLPHFCSNILIPSWIEPVDSSFPSFSFHLELGLQ